MKVYILSGGKSSRMGSDKGLAKIDGKPLVAYLIETLQKLNVEINIIAHHAEYFNFNCRVIEDVYKEKGPVGGIYTALKDAQDEVLVLSVDTPFIKEKHINKLLEQHQQGHITLAYSEAKMYPLCGMYPYQLVDVLESSILENRLKLMQFIEEQGYQKVNFEFTMLEKMNINTLDALDIAEKLYRNGN